jgi:hypothetical protein
MEKPMELLYHYTTPEGLIGIVKENCLRATSAFYVKDSDELIGGVRLAHEQLFTIRETITDAQQAERIDWLLHDTRDIGTPKFMSAFVCSLSEEGDLLSQWRAYCRCGGFAIGFPSQLLKEKVEAQGFTLHQCIYEKAKQEAAMRSVLKSVALPWIEADPSPASEDNRRFGVSGNLVFEMIRTASRLKHASFAEEREWRIVSPPEKRIEAHERHFRAKNGLIVPYVEVHLPEGIDFWGKVCIMVGPSPHPIESKRSVYDLVHSHKGHAICVEISRSPYREW